MLEYIYSLTDEYTIEFMNMIHEGCKILLKCLMNEEKYEASKEDIDMINEIKDKIQEYMYLNKARRK
jgi:hypothetical protein